MRWWENEQPTPRVFTVEGPFPRGAPHAGSVTLRAAEPRDIPTLAALRAEQWQTHAYWQQRIRGYLDGTANPQQALPERAAFVAEEKGTVVGFVAGHRTLRHGCQGEIEWINVAALHRGRRLSQPLLLRMAAWFMEQKAYRVCVNVRDDNQPAVALYTRAGAHPLQPGWMFWEDIRKLNTAL